MKYTVPQLMQFILEHYPKARDWNPGQLFNWLSWNIEMGFCLIVGEEDKMTGLAIVRPVMHPEQVLNNLDFDPEGDCYYVDLTIALPPKRESMQALGFAVIKRFGQRDKIAFQIQGEGPIIITDAREHRRRLLRILNYGAAKRT